MRIGILALAIIAAGLAAFLARTLVSSDQPQQASAPREPETPLAEVLVAAGDIGLGQRVGKNDLSWQPWPLNAVAASYVTRTNQPNALDVFAGAIARGPLTQGEPVSSAKLVSYENAGFMSALLSPGMRAVSTKISPETGAGGFILPNDRVDVIVTMRLRANGEGGETFRSQTILRNVRILAIDQTFKEVEGDQVVVGKTATLEMLPEQAEGFALAEAQGTVSLTLRPLADLAGGARVPESVARSGNAPISSGEGNSVRILRFGNESAVAAMSGRTP